MEIELLTIAFIGLLTIFSACFHGNDAFQSEVEENVDEA